MYTLAFSEIKPSDKALVGGKGHALAQLTHLAVPVPDGFVVTTVAYGDTTKRAGYPSAETIASSHDFILPAELEAEVLARLGRLNGALFAVRSSSVSEDSADRSFAGIFESFLNVPPDRVIEYVTLCYASLHSPRAQQYLRGEEPIAVVVQEMVDSRLSGVLFTQHPTSADPNVVVIETCHGLGELLVAGTLTPDSYILDKQSGAVLAKRSGNQQTKLVTEQEVTREVPVASSDTPITSQELRALVTIARRIERHFNAPCDVEWCVAEDGPRIVQSRPITAVCGSRPERHEDRAFSKRFSARVLSPVFEQANVAGFHRYGQAQFELPFSLSGYHVYQPSVRHPMGEVDIWVNDDIDSAIVGHFKKSIRSDYEYLGRLEGRYLRLVDRFRAFCERAEQTRFDATTGDLMSTLHDFHDLNQAMTSVYNAPIFAVVALAEALQEELQSADPATADQDFATISVSGIPNSVFLQEVERLRLQLVADRDSAGQLPDSKRNRRLIDLYCRRWRYLGCTDVIGDPYPVVYFEEKVRELSYRDAREAWDRLADKQRTDSAELHEVLAKYPNLHYEIFWLRTWLFHRNHTTEDYYRSFQCLRPLLLKVASVLEVTYRDLLNLSTEEMIQALAGSLPDYRRRAVERGTEGFRLEQRGDEAFLETGIDARARLEREIQSADVLSGQIANRGYAVGVVRIIRDPVGEADRFRPGDVLVTAMTAPSFVPLMQQAAAIVTDEGGILCHAAVVSREMGKPCVIAVRNATHILRDEMRVEVDADVGQIKVLDRPVRSVE